MRTFVPGVSFGTWLKMKCKYCSEGYCIRKGKRGIRQRLKCTSCGKFQQDGYCFQLYDPKDDLKIKVLNAEGVGIRSMSRILGYSPGTVLRRILYLSSQVTKPIYFENNQVYEADEMWTYVGKNKPENYVWITFAINRSTCSVIDLVIGPRSSANLGRVIAAVKTLNPRKIITDKLNTYTNLVHPFEHDTRPYANNRIERMNLTLRTHLKRLTRHTICYSKSEKMLNSCILLYLDYHYWCLKMS